MDLNAAAATIAQTGMQAGQFAALNATINATSAKSDIIDQQQHGMDVASENKAQAETKLNRFEKMAKWVRDTKNKAVQWASEKTQWRIALMDKIRRHGATLALAQAHMIKFMAVMARFFPLIKICIIAIMIFSNALQYVIMFLAAIAIALLIVIYKILSIPGFDFICIGVFWFFMVFCPFIFYTVVLVVLFVVICAFCIILTVFNYMTSGGMKNFLFCENNPAGWYKMANYHLRNIYSREFFCSKPCLKGYAPDVSGSFCERQKRAAPNFCPQASVMRILTNDGRKDTKVGYSKFNDKTNLNYRTSLPFAREKMLQDHYFDMKKYMETCTDKLRNYDGVTKSICASVDTIEKYNLYGMKKTDIERLKLACAQSFCNSVNSYPFCANLSGMSKDADEMLIKMLVKFFISVIIFLIVIITFMQILKEA